VLERKREVVEWSWRGLMQVFAPVEIEDIEQIYNYDS